MSLAVIVLLGLGLNTLTHLTKLMSAIFRLAKFNGRNSQHRSPLTPHLSPRQDYRINLPKFVNVMSVNINVGRAAGGGPLNSMAPKLQ